MDSSIRMILKRNKLKPLFSSSRTALQRLLRRCPRKIRILCGPLLGGLIGLAGGIPGIFIGLLLGGLLGKLFIRSVEDKRIVDYFESPGLQEFNEGESGMAAWCALAVLISSKNFPEFSANSSSAKTDDSVSSQFFPAGEKTIRHVVMAASGIFTGPNADPYLLEHFTRLALANINKLNPDLLSESLAARRISRGDAGDLCRALCVFAEKEKACDMLQQICLILDPLQAEETAKTRNRSGIGKETPRDPWKVLGLSPGTPPNEIKKHYRTLAKQFHPDELEVLDERHRETAARAFIAIKEAYREIAGIE